MRIFGGERVKALMYRLGMTEGCSHRVQANLPPHRKRPKSVEAQNFDARKHLLEYDDVMNKQRETITAFVAPRWKEKISATTFSKSPKTSPANLSTLSVRASSILTSGTPRNSSPR